MGSARLRIAIFVACGLVAVAGIACDAREPHHPPESRPNVLLVTIDTLRADHVGAYGARGDATPMIDRIASRGVRFETAISPAPLTLPAHASLLTGLNPPRHGVRHNGFYQLSDDRLTLAERFQDAGYQTGAVVGAIVLAGKHGLGQGFDFYHDRDFTKGAGSHGTVQRSASEVTDRALEWLGGAQRPYFLWVHYFDPHRDFTPPPPYSDDPDPYAGEIRYVDAEIERLLGGPDLADVLDDTVVALVADHGESLGEHGEDSHSYTLYDASLRVPMLMAGPSVPAGRVVADVVGLIDLGPTLLGLAGLDPFEEADGVDLSNDWSTQRHGVYSETLATQLDHGWAPLHSVRTKHHRYVRAPKSELYDLATDPEELTNLLGSGGGANAEGTRLDGLISAALSLAVDATARDVDTQTRGQLADLGYLLNNEVAQNDIDPKDGLVVIAKLDDAQSAFYAGQREQALKMIQEVLAEHPELATAHALLSRIQVQLGQPEVALREAKEAVRIAPQIAGYRADYGTLLLNRGQTELAVEQFRAGIALDPHVSILHVGLMWIDARAGNLDAAIEHERRLIELSPGDPQTLIAIGGFWNQFRQPDRAFSAFQQAHALQPTVPQLNLELALLAVRLGREAQPYLETAGPLLDTPENGNRLARAYAGSGESRRALELLEQLAARHPDSKPIEKSLMAIREQVMSEQSE